MGRTGTWEGRGRGIDCETCTRQERRDLHSHYSLSLTPCLNMLRYGIRTKILQGSLRLQTAPAKMQQFSLCEYRPRWDNYHYFFFFFGSISMFLRMSSNV